MTILVGISGYDLDRGFHCASSDTAGGKPYFLHHMAVRRVEGLLDGLRDTWSSQRVPDALVRHHTDQAEPQAYQPDLANRCDHADRARHGVFSAGRSSVYFLEGVP